MAIDAHYHAHSSYKKNIESLTKTSNINTISSPNLITYNSRWVLLTLGKCTMLFLKSNERILVFYIFCSRVFVYCYYFFMYFVLRFKVILQIFSRIIVKKQLFYGNLELIIIRLLWSESLLIYLIPYKSSYFSSNFKLFNASSSYQH